MLITNRHVNTFGECQAAAVTARDDDAMFTGKVFVGTETQVHRSAQGGRKSRLLSGVLVMR